MSEKSTPKVKKTFTVKLIDGNIEIYEGDEKSLYCIENGLLIIKLISDYETKEVLKMGRLRRNSRKLTTTEKTITFRMDLVHDITETVVTECIELI